jgi:hypothetical protein
MAYSPTWLLSSRVVMPPVISVRSARGARECGAPRSDDPLGQHHARVAEHTWVDLCTMRELPNTPGWTFAPCVNCRAHLGGPLHHASCRAHLGGPLHCELPSRPSWRGYQRARARRAERGGPSYMILRFIKMYGDFSSLFMVKNRSETPRHGEPWELGDG